MFLKNKELNDERVMAQRYKIGYEGFYLLFGLLLMSITIKSVFIVMSFQMYWTEFAMLIVGAFYVTLRHVLTGSFNLDFQGDKKESKRRRYYLLLSIFFSGAAGLAMGIRNFIMYDFSAYKIILVVLPIMFLLSPLLYMMLTFLDKATTRRADKITNDDQY